MTVSDNLQEFLHATQWHEAVQPAGEMQYFLRDPEHVTVLCHSIDHGFEMPRASVERILEFIRQVSTTEAAEMYWRQTTHVMFEMDERYTDTRFQFIVNLRAGNWKSHFDRVAAFRQLRRMCESGRADVGRMRAIVTSNPDDTKFAGEDEFIFACSVPQRMRLENHLQRTRMVQQRLNRDGYGDNGMVDQIAKIESRIAVAERVGDEFFVQHWLRAALSEAEWSEVRDLDPGMLRGLYPQVWEAGYEGYRQAVVVR